MCPKKLTFLILIFKLAFGFSQNHEKQDSIENTLKTVSVDSLSYVFKNYNIEDYANAVAIAVKMSNDQNNIKIKEKGVNLMATLARNFTKLVTSKYVDLDDERVVRLLERFEIEKYYIEKPKVSRFIKLMNYLCKGDYTYVHHKLIGTRAYNILWVFVFLYFSIFLFSYSNKCDWKHEKKFRKFTLFSIALLIILFILFKSTCHGNIKDYSFYGISV
ncbi:hypothetical protein [Winogradskyella schleiferi]|uniref:hypothetical protein n=1 Tax=Winogradskyella schleiferi TaxID=2686078 RepID=UPI0015B7B566|nr:hypothetical protein [Winogradskyella schleiferi]